LSFILQARQRLLSRQDIIGDTVEDAGAAAEEPNRDPARSSPHLQCPPPLLRRSPLALQVNHPGDADDGGDTGGQHSLRRRVRQLRLHRRLNRRRRRSRVRREDRGIEGAASRKSIWMDVGCK